MKTKFFVAGTALCLSIVTSCDNDAIENSDLHLGDKMLMTMQTVGPQTRADYTDTGNSMAFSWRNGDKISVAVNGVPGNENSMLTTSVENKNAPFSGSVTPFSGTKNIYAFYPFSQTGYTVLGGDNSSTATASLTLPNPQLYTVNGAISNSFMVGAGTATATGTAISANASLKQVMSVVNLNITNAPGKVVGVKLRCTEALFPTTATVKLSDATISNPGNFVNKLSMVVTDGTTETSKKVFFAMFPVNLTNKTISVEVAFQGGLVKTIDKLGISFVGNKFYVMTFDGSNAVAANYIEPAGSGVGLEWAVGNLVANGANGAKIGKSNDDGLYFQFGSLVGWSGGLTGDGTGRAANNSLILSQIVTPSGYTGGPTWNSSWTGSLTTENVATGTGDPCKYYLGGSWRLPTKDEYVALFGSGWTNGWSWIYSPNSAIHTSGLKFPASGYRISTGYLNTVTAGGYCWSSTPSSSTHSYYMSFNVSNVRPSNVSSQASGFTVRCVRANN